MKILFLHGWNSVPGGVKPTYLKDDGHEVINPALPHEDFAEAVRIAQAGVHRARGLQMQARSQYLPQVGASLTYTRTLASQFEALADAGPPAPPAT